MFSSILSAIAAIPALIAAIQELLAYFKKAEEEKWFSDLHETIQALKQAKTPEEKIDAAKSIQDKISSM